MNHGRSRKGNLFGQDGPDPSDEDFKTPVYCPDPDKAREEITKDSSEGAGGKGDALGHERVAFYRTVFPQMTSYLPEDEGAQLRFDLEMELAWLEAAGSAPTVAT